MLIIDEQLLEIDQLIDQLVEDFTQTPKYSDYQAIKINFENDSQLQEKIKTLQENMDYLNFRAELKTLQKEIISHPLVYQLKLAENDLQAELNTLSKHISQTISTHIYVDENLPLKGGSRHDRHHKTH